MSDLLQNSVPLKDPEHGYGKLKDKTFRIAHMADIQPAHIEVLTAAMDEFLQKGA